MAMTDVIEQEKISNLIESKAEQYLIAKKGYAASVIANKKFADFFYLVMEKLEDDIWELTKKYGYTKNKPNTNVGSTLGETDARNAAWAWR